jgi:hypothetical protein
VGARPAAAARGTDRDDEVGNKASTEVLKMTTTVDALGGRNQKISHRGVVALGVAAILAVGGVTAGIAVAADNDSSSPAPAHIVQTPGVHAHPDPLATRYGQHESAPLPEQPMLRVGGPR